MYTKSPGGFHRICLVETLLTGKHEIMKYMKKA